MPFQIVHNDITKMETDAIVNAANSRLQCGGGVCGAIFKAAGKDQLQKECDKIGGCYTGEAVITKGYKLKAKYVVHAVGPVWQGGNKHEETFLRNAYKNSLKAAKAAGCQSIAFPLISAGIYGYPKREALRVAMDVFTEFLMEDEMDIYLVVFDRKVVEISGKLFKDITHYIDENYEPDTYYRFNRKMERKIDIELMDKMCQPQAVECLPTFSIDGDVTEIERKLADLINKTDETFSQMLLRLIDERHLKDSDVYKKANLDRKLFSKIRNNKDYSPKKTTALAFAIALELSLDETVDLLKAAGYSLTDSSKFDIIIKFFIENQSYDIFEINEVLFYFHQDTLGSLS